MKLYSLWSIHSKYETHLVRISHSEREQKFDNVEDDLNATQDGESGEKPHGASNKTQGGLQSHLHIFLNLVVGCSTKVDLNHFQSWILDGASWEESLSF